MRGRRRRRRRRRREKTGVEVGKGCTGGVLSCLVSNLRKWGRADGVMVGEMGFALGVGFAVILASKHIIRMLMPISLLIHFLHRLQGRLSPRHSDVHIRASNSCPHDLRTPLAHCELKARIPPSLHLAHQRVL